MEQQEIIWSVSLIPYHPSFGYLFCNETRLVKRTGKTRHQTHPIGGKVEASDRDPLFASLREFVEETKLDAISQQGEAVYAELEPLMASVVWFDYVVYQDHLQQKIHRFYLWDITHVDSWIIPCILHLPESFAELPREMKGNVRFLYWVKREYLSRVRNKSPLTDAFLQLSAQR